MLQFSILWHRHAIRDHARLPISKTQPSENNPGSVRKMPIVLFIYPAKFEG